MKALVTLLLIAAAGTAAAQQPDEWARLNALPANNESDSYLWGAQWFMKDLAPDCVVEATKVVDDPNEDGKKWLILCRGGARYVRHILDPDGILYRYNPMTGRLERP